MQLKETSFSDVSTEQRLRKYLSVQNVLIKHVYFSGKRSLPTPTVTCFLASIKTTEHTGPYSERKH